MECETDSSGRVVASAPHGPEMALWDSRSPSVTAIAPSEGGLPRLESNSTPKTNRY
jgi:hypothetical protein